jgi:hypothetical protein
MCRSAHLACSPSPPLKLCGTVGPSSGNLFFDLVVRRAVLANADPRGVDVVPADDERVSFEEDIKPLFRPVDHESMAWAFDLASYDDVKENATAILERLRNGSMPCDGAWPEGQVERFQRWTETGMHE